MFKKLLITFISTFFLLTSTTGLAATYKIDKEGQHASIVFRIQHLGYSWLYGFFKDFDGSFTFDPNNPAADSVNVTIQTNSIDTNHAERDKHIRGKDFLNVDQFKQASFKSTAVEKQGNNYIVNGNLTLHGVTKPITINAQLTGEGKDPWGGERAGFYGTTKIALKDFNIMTDLGPKSQEVELILSVEGVKQK